jgi:iron complex outermembrane receptor protein
MLLLGASLSFGVAAPAVAQDVPQIGEIVVTARRVEERLQDVPISITVYNQQQLQQKNITYPGDLATYTPSLSVNTQFGVDNTQFTLRGFTQQLQTSPTVGVYFADVVAPRGGPTIATGDGAGPGDFFDLQNIQVLKGPQGTLFGRNTTGGAVLLVPNKPTGKYEGYIEGSLGDFGLKRIQAVVNIPATDTLRLRFGVDRETRDGYTHNISGIGPTDFNNIDYTAARASVTWDITPELQNYSVFSYTNSTTHGAEAQMYLCNVGQNINPETGKPYPAPGLPFLPALACGQIAQQQAAGPYTVENNQTDPHSSLHEWQLINTTTWDANSWLTVKNITSYAHLRNSYQSNLFGDNFILPNIPAIFGTFAGSPLEFVSVDAPPGTAIADQTTFTEELQFQGHNFDNRLTWQAGAYLEVSRPGGANHAESPTLVQCTNLYALQCTDVLGGVFSNLAHLPPGIILIGQVTDKPDAIDYRNLAGYAQATWKFNDQWKLTGGLRYTSDRTRSWARVINYLFPTPNNPIANCQSTLTTLAEGCFTGFEQASAKPTWLVDVDYTPRTDMLFYAKYARGYRQGDVNPVGPDGFQTWGPESVDSYEAGAKTTFNQPFPVTFNVAVFYNKLTNQQIFTGFQGPPPAVPNSSVINAGRSRIWGIEFETMAEPVHNLTVDVAYTYLNSKLEALNFTIPTDSIYNVITPASLPGDPMQYTPKHKASVTIDYALPLADNLGKISFGGTYVYTDPQLVERDNPWGTLPAYSLLTLHAEWRNILQKPVDLSFFMTNATNKYYWTSMVDLTESVGWATRTLAEPRMYGFRLRYHWGT